jgi:hypothetical protein
MHLDSVTLHVLWRETDTRLDVLAARVREGVDVLAASEFVRWLQFSGLLKVLEAVDQPFPLPVRGVELRRKAADLQMECGDWFRTHEHSNTQPHPQIPRTDLERINAQLAQLRETISELTRPPVETPAAVSASLRVIEGGAS